jgi:hypothetical protein
MCVTGERMGDEHGVAAFVIERTPGFVGDGDLGKHTPTFEHERPLTADLGELTVADRVALAPCTGGGQARGETPGGVVVEVFGSLGHESWLRAMSSVGDGVSLSG